MLCAAIPMGGLLGWRCLHFADTGVLALLHLLAGAPISITCDTVGNGPTASGPALMEPHPRTSRALLRRCRSSFSSCCARQRSTAICALSQNSGEVLSNLAKRRAVVAVRERRPLTMPFTSWMEWASNSSPRSILPARLRLPSVAPSPVTCALVGELVLD